MNRILLASALVLGVSGAAMAQETSVHVGNFSASVQSSLDRDAHQVDAAATRQTEAGSIDRMTTASTGSVSQNDLSSTLRLGDDAYNR